MTEVFADTAYWIAFLLPNDKYHNAAVIASRGLNDRKLITSQMVIAEVLNDFAGRGAYLRQLAVALISRLDTQDDIIVIPQSGEGFAEALSLYRDRPDKSWSLTDCSSMVICSQRAIVDVLTSDKHFIQAGLNTLMASNS